MHGLTARLGRHFLIVVAGCAATIGVTRAADDDTASVQSAAPLNVVLILADDLGWADLGCYGADLHETPHLDRLAREGIRFTNAYAASICSPTRAALLTGKHYARLHMTIWREGSLRDDRDHLLKPPATVSNLPLSETTIAERLHLAGYQTALVGKWHLGDADHYPETQGFDVNIGGTHWGAPNTYFYPYKGVRRAGGEFRYVPGLDGGREGEYLTDRFTDEAIRFIDRAAERPFFLYLAQHAVHTPIQAKGELVERYHNKLAPELHHKNAAYAAMVHSLDESVGRVLKRLEQDGLAERTVVIFLSDNGGYVNPYDDLQVTDNRPLRSGKGSLYEGGVRVPLLIRWPGVTQPGGVCDEPVCVMDLFATIAEAAGGPLEAEEARSLDGLSLMPLLKEPTAQLPRDALYFHYPHYYATTSPAGAVRQRDWKLIEYFEDGRLELYNLRDDLGESNNLAAKQPELTRQLHDKLRAWRASVAAQLPTR
ncbi:MAG: sulfatase [Pirellulales bacterium]